MGTSVHSLTLVAVMTALFCVLAPFVIPIGLVPFSLATLLLYLYLLIFPPKKVFACTIVYLFLGLLGLPVFSGFSGGMAKLVGPTGGYLMGYLFLSLFSGWFLARLSKKERSVWGNRIGTFFALLLGTLCLHAIGSAWFCFSTNSPLMSALTLCILPFFPIDVLKIILAMILKKPLKKSLKLNSRK